jgi:hypothetical protein
LTGRVALAQRKPQSVPESLQQPSLLDSVIGVEAVRKSFVVLVRGMVTEHLAVRGALEGLETCLAFYREGGGVLTAGISKTS